ncbi:MAG: hypothetical protein P1V20_09545 [Verrucomicrobiales bacterium]|nr:hypothetical protein [Verrucomicrobiales bacterium]
MATYRWNEFIRKWHDALPATATSAAPNESTYFHTFETFVTHPFGDWPPSSTVSIDDFAVPHLGKIEIVSFIYDITGEISDQLQPENYRRSWNGLRDAAIIRAFADMETGNTGKALEQITKLAAGLSRSDTYSVEYYQFYDLDFRPSVEYAFYHLLWHSLERRVWNSEEIDTLIENFQSLSKADQYFIDLDRTLESVISVDISQLGRISDRIEGLFYTLHRPPGGDPAYLKQQFTSIVKCITPDYVLINRNRKTMEKYLVQALEIRQIEDFILIACNLEKFYLEKGQYPDSLEDLAAELPRDRFAPSLPVIYQKENGRYRLSSLGTNSEGAPIFWSYPAPVFENSDL